MPNSLGTMPYIKTEPDEFGTSATNFIGSGTNYNGSQHFSSNYNHNHHQTNGSINPSDLSMDGNFGSLQYGFGTQNMASSFNVGHSGFGEDELLESLSFPGGQGGMDEFGMHQTSSGRQVPSNSINTQSQMSNMYSNTPDGHPIQSPFLGNFDFNQFRPVNSLPQHMSPHQNSAMLAKRPSLATAHRKSSEQRSPLTPRTAAMASLHLGTPDPINVQNGRAIRTPSMQNRHQKTLSGQYDSTPGSLQSYLDSPLSSPRSALPHAGISETLGSKHASLPAKVETQPPTQNLETVEAKKRRRRASHNAVERRRRDNINERIQDLSHLVPGHRLEDDKVRKQLANQGPLSPITGASNMSPPNAATSLLAGANGRRAASTSGNITLGLPIEEKEKGPNKGDILNGSVSWTRDLMWALHQKYNQEEELMTYITSLGGSWPFQISEDDKRMRSELLDVYEKNEPSSFQYTRTDGTGLHVPKHTTLSGNRLRQGSSSSPPSNFELSPGFHSGGSGTNSGSNGAGHAQYWHSAGHAGMSFKEEDEFMDIV